MRLSISAHIPSIFQLVEADCKRDSTSALSKVSVCARAQRIRKVYSSKDTDLGISDSQEYFTPCTYDKSDRSNMDYFLQSSSPPELPARSPLRNSTIHQTITARSPSRPQYEDEGDAYMDERHYTALSRKIDDVLETIGSEWPLAPIVDQELRHAHVDDTSSSIYSQSLISDDESPTSTPELHSRAPSLDATYGRDSLPPTPTESWSSDASECQQKKLWTVTERLHIRRDSINDEYDGSEPVPMITTDQIFDMIENLPERIDRFGLDVDKRRVEYGVPFSYSKGPSTTRSFTNVPKDDPIQLVRAGSRNQRRSPSLLSRTSSIRSAAKRLSSLL